jgi:small subunit ribosomal protein S9
MDEYFPREALQIMIRTPFDTTESLGRYDIAARLNGGGVAGQAGALRHGIARAIEKLDATQRTVLKKAGYLTRDPRKKERKKYGQKGARARFQFSKR